ncbi:MAG: LamG domain-containing protein, partial [Planctomycetaceae bacterium]|nr:LamG domain-containing protein [Planctomycetaceae bacterium]
ANADKTLLWRKNEEGDALPANQHDSFTISFWSKIQGNGQNDLRVFSESNTQGNNNPLFNIGTRNNGSDGTIDIYIRGAGPTVGHIFSTAEPFDDEWHHVVFVQNDLERSIYVDGELDDLEIAAKPESGWDDIDATTIGGILRGNASHWVTGLIDDVGIWKRALSADEVSELNASGIPQGGGELVPGLIAYWPFDGDLQDAVGDSHGEGMGSEDIVYGSGKFGQGIELDGVDQFVETPLDNEEMFDFQDGTGFSISAWYKVGEFTKSWQALIAKGEG